MPCVVGVHVLEFPLFLDGLPYVAPYGIGRAEKDALRTILLAKKQTMSTAGIREAQDAIESLGVQRTMEKIGQAAILVYVWDVAGGMTLREVHEDLNALIPRGQADAPAFLVVCNKMDKNPLFETTWLVDPAQAGIHPYLLEETAAGSAPLFPLQAEDIVAVSARNRMNVEYLKEKL